jgi:hypothetical protein
LSLDALYLALQNIIRILKHKKKIKRNKIMTLVEQKAKELFDEFEDKALIVVDEILTALDEHQWQNRNVIEFYFYVKQDIQKLSQGIFTKECLKNHIIGEDDGVDKNIIAGVDFGDALGLLDEIG